MKRRFVSVLLCLLLVGSMALTCFASELPLVLDYADLLTDTEAADLEMMARLLQKTYQIDAVILTVNSLDGKTPMQYAEDFYDENGYGSDAERSGTLFLLSMEDRDWYIDTSGNAIYALSDYVLYEIEELVLPYLRNGNYYGAFNAWLEALDGYFQAYEDGSPVDGYVPEEDKFEGHDETVYYEYDDDDASDDYYDRPSVNWLISIGVGLIAGAVTVLIMAGTMNTKRRQNSAGEYLKNGSYQLKVRRDIFLYSQVSKTRRDTDSGSSSGSRSRSGGGSSVHRSSSGRSHGGRGGKF